MDIDSFFDKPFDEGTLTKLELFRLYVVEWFSTFAVNTDPTLKQITIYDFFAGAGCDSNGHNGSPIIICDAKLIAKYGIKSCQTIPIDAVSKTNAKLECINERCGCCFPKAQIAINKIAPIAILA